jgi:hypothetical protein
VLLAGAGALGYWLLRPGQLVYPWVREDARDTPRGGEPPRQDVRREDSAGRQLRSSGWSRAEQVPERPRPGYALPPGDARAPWAPRSAHLGPGSRSMDDEPRQDVHDGDEVGAEPDASYEYSRR